MKMKILITVKTYPAISSKYDEIVCTAGINEDGNWVRIYPIPFRKLEDQYKYKKYQWIEFDLEKNKSDFRPESFKPVNYKFEIIGDPIDTSDNWKKRKEFVLKNVYYNIQELINDAKNKDKCVSLAVFKPKEIINFHIEELKSREWDKNKLLSLKQMKLFDEVNLQYEYMFKIVKKIPYKFSYEFIDNSNNKSKLMIEDWEIGQLYWNCLKSSKGDEKEALVKVRKKFFDEIALKKDLYLFLGTTKAYHKRAKNPFIIIGTFYPNLINQETLF